MSVKDRKGHVLCEGDTVKVNDSSYATRVDCYDPNSHVLSNVANNEYTVLHVLRTSGHLRTENTNRSIHDIFIQKKDTRAIYLHSSAFVTKVPVCECCGQFIEDDGCN